MCCYLRSVVIYDAVIPEGFCVAVNGEKFWARNQRRYKRYVVIPDVVVSEVYCTYLQKRRQHALQRSAAALKIDRRLQAHKKGKLRR